MKKKFLRRDQVEALTGLSRSTIYNEMDEGRFPRPYRVAKRAVAWTEADIQKWMDERPIAGPGA